MKDSIGEMVIAQKINALETADESVQVNTEELWNKLERSLNKKATKKISLYRYWPAAVAAILLIAAFIATLLPSQNAVVTPHFASSKRLPGNITIATKKEPMLKTQELRETAFTSHKKSQKTRLKATKSIIKRDQDIADIEDNRQPGMYTTPVINEVCYNTTIADGLACY
jgi:hypothetical protein